jgi:hypothetical protein
LAIRLAVAPPGEAMLTEAAARGFAERLAEALQAQEVPAVATEAPLPLDWRLVVKATPVAGMVRPSFELQDADGQGRGAAAGAPVPVRGWAEASPETLGAAAREAAPRIAALLGTIQAARAGAEPAQIAGREQRVRVMPGTGAPGDGNTVLPARLGEFLARRGYVTQNTAEGAALAVAPQINLVRTGPAVQRVEIQWIVSRRDGEELGRVLQLNEVPAGRLDRFWSDVAYAAAEEAAGGVDQVIRNATAPPATP